MGRGDTATIDVASRWRARLDRVAAGVGLTTVFQPIVDLHRATIVGYEALARFEAVDGEALGPDRWFAAAADVGRSGELDALSLASALRARSGLPPNCFLTVNVDPESLLDPTVHRVLATAGPLTGLVIEITEHRPWDWACISPVVQRLRANGARFAVDDAGAGHSGLQQILCLRPSILKLDRSLVAGVDEDEAKVALIEMLGAFADRIDAWVLAEGVETAAEARRLVGMGVPLGQGYFFGRPGRPWSEIDGAAQRAVAESRQHLVTDGLHRLITPVVAAGPGDDLGRAWATASLPWLPVVDELGQPQGVVHQHSAAAGTWDATLTVNVHSSPCEVAHRLSTAGSEPSMPVLVTDDSGHYLGLVTVRRLLSTLAGRSDLS